MDILLCIQSVFPLSHYLDHVKSIDVLFDVIDKSSDGIHRLQINPFIRSKYDSMAYGIRELNTTETMDFCVNGKKFTSVSEMHVLTSNYSLRLYVSGCFYLSNDGEWRSDGLRVSDRNESRMR